jgi:hypothetical protein
MTQPQPDLAVATVVAYQQQTAALRQQLAQFLTALWKSLGVYRNQQMADFTAQAVPMVTGAQQQMSSLTSAYVAAQAETQIGRFGSPSVFDPAKVTGSALRNGASMDEVYGRPFHLVWRDLAAGKTPEQAIQAGEDRAVLTSQTDLQLAKTHTAQQAMAKDEKVSGYRRTLEGPHSCGLCIVASTQVYHKAKLLPIHPGCDCEVTPVYGESDPGLVVNERHLADVHQAIEDRFGQSSAGARAIPGQKGLQYRDVLIEHHNGELGPVLGVRGQQFTGPSDLH